MQPPELPTITSPYNPRIKLAVRLRQRRGRDQQGRIIIDGLRESLRALDAGIRIEQAFVNLPQRDQPLLRQTIERLRQAAVDIQGVPPSIFEKIAFGQRGDGLVVTACTPQPELGSIRLGANPLVVVVEAIEKPGNVGAVLRTADAVGASAVVHASPVTDLYNPNVIRSSLGAVFTLPVCEADADRCLVWLREHGMTIYTARVGAATRYTEPDYRGPTAIVLGSETHGLTSVWQGDDILPVSLPMHGAVDSLNISATAAVLMYEVLRQRRVDSSS